MMPPKYSTIKGPLTIQSQRFDPDQFFEKWGQNDLDAPEYPVNDFKHKIIDSFNLRISDNYVYHAIASVTLPQVQSAIDYGNRNGLLAWYTDSHGRQIESPPISDIEAYVNVFSSKTFTARALITLEKNAKKDSIRAKVAAHLTSKRSWPDGITIPKLKKAHVNPYFDFWSWACKALAWAGPEHDTVKIQQSHHVLPVFYHHFGCVCPSFEALEALKQLSAGRPIVELGSGNGYWTFILRRLGLTVYAVDNGDSLWRTLWISDTVKMDGAEYLQRESGCSASVLLLVYPQVTTEFTTSVLQRYKGDTICIAGTQNANGFTAFKDIGIEEYLAKEKKNFQKIIQTPLPSFPGKDEAFFVFQKKG